jgi:hypothetical protein
VTVLGKAAWDALGRHAPQCAVFAWIWDLVSTQIRTPILDHMERSQSLAPPVLDYLAGVATRELMLHFEVGPDSRLPQRPPTEAEFAAVLRGTGRLGLAALAEDALSQAKGLEALSRMALQEAEEETPRRKGGPSPT